MNVITADSSTAMASTNVTTDSGRIGLVRCPCDHNGTENVTGYLVWDDMVDDINNLACSNASMAHTFTLCPNSFNASNSSPILIEHNYITIQCGATGRPEGCVVNGASIVVTSRLVGITLSGIDFVNQQQEISIGHLSGVHFEYCRFRDTHFPGSGYLRAAVVSAGRLTARNCVFANNLGQGAVLVESQTAFFQHCQFINNRAAEWDHYASAIQVGAAVNVYSNRTTSAKVSIRDSCFENCLGKYVVLLEPNSTLYMNTKNAVLNTDGGVVCEGVTTIVDKFIRGCHPFQYFNTSCNSRITMTSAPTMTSVSMSHISDRPSLVPSAVPTHTSHNNTNQVPNLHTDSVRNSSTGDDAIPLQASPRQTTTTSGVGATVTTISGIIGRVAVVAFLIHAV